MIKIKTGYISLEEFQELCNKCESYRDVLRQMGYSPDSGTMKVRIKKDIADNNINITHFKGQGHSKNIGVRRTPTEKYLNNEIKITSHKLRLRLLEDNIFEPKCNVCKNTNWMNRPIPLELHHKDGNKENNDLNNLELLCPNCHCFTDTYKTMNWK